MKEIDSYDDSEVGAMQELGGPESSGKNWKGIGIALLVIAVICSLVILAIFLIAPTAEDYQRDGSPITLRDITDGSFNPSFKEVQWLSDHELLYQSDTNQSVILYDLKSGIKSIIVDARSIVDKIDNYFISPTRQYLLYTQNTQKVYRHTTKANYRLLRLNSNKAESVNLLNSWELVPNSTAAGVKLQYAKWSPTGNKLIFIYQNDIYYRNAPESEVVRITDSGSTDEKPQVVYNGLPDWLYEEEVFGTDNTMWWSPDSKHIAYLSFNDTNVDTFSFDTYGGDVLTAQYTNATKIRYPKAGRVNPTVSLYILNPDQVAETKTLPREKAAVKPPKAFIDKQFYITSAAWLNADSLFVRWTNRYQNMSQITVCSPKTLECPVVTTLQTSKGWLEDSPPYPIDEGKRFHMLSGNFIPLKDQFHHQTVCTYATTPNAVNPEVCLDVDFDVTEIVAVDPNDSSTIYAMAAYPVPRERHLLRLKKGETPVCLTCNSTKCTFFDDVKFGSRSSVTYLTLTCRGPNAPYSEIWKLPDLPMQSDVNAAVDVIKSNDAVQKELEKKALPHRKYIQVPLSSLPNGPSAQVELLIPPKLAEFAKHRYPLLIKVYGGPGTQEVHSRFRVDFEEMLASSHEVVIARIDGRGSAMQGFDMKYQVYRHLGNNEVLDQLEVAKYLLDNYPYLDPDRVGIWGWSYGGYATARAVVRDQNPQIIKCAASVAPVTDWRFYDTAYTERFMSTPQDNSKGYEESSLTLPYSSKIRDLSTHFSRVSYMLIHGTADDNVHFQQAAQFTKALMKAGVLFRTQVYPDEDHSIRKLRYHLYSTLLDHFMKCFGDGAAVEKADE